MYCYKNMTKTMLAHTLNSFMQEVVKPRAFKAEHLGGTPRQVAGLQCLFQTYGMALSVLISSTLSTRRGTYYAKDILLWSDGGPVCVGICQSFLEVQFADATSACFAFMHQMTCVGGAVYSKAPLVPVFVAARAIRSAMAFRSLGQNHVCLAMRMIL
jgi:hypothetical protein